MKTIRRSLSVGLLFLGGLISGWWGSWWLSKPIEPPSSLLSTAITGDKNRPRKTDSFPVDGAQSQTPAFVLSLPRDVVRADPRLTTEFFRALARKNPDRALLLAAEEAPQNRPAAFAGAFAGWAERQPQDAWTHALVTLRELPVASRRELTALLLGADQSYRNVRFTNEAAAWMNFEEIHRGSGLNPDGTAVQERWPDKADPEQRRIAALRVLRIVQEMSQPLIVADWVRDHVPEAEARNELIEGVLARWTKEKPLQALAWARELPPNALTDGARGVLAEGLSRIAPENANALLTEMTDAGQRLATVASAILSEEGPRAINRFRWINTLGDTVRSDAVGFLYETALDRLATERADLNLQQFVQTSALIPDAHKADLLRHLSNRAPSSRNP